MCNFRIITKIRDEQGRIIDTSDCTSIPPNKMDDITDEGLYHICATGSCHLYYDGNEWLSEFDQSTYKAWKESDWYRPGWIPVAWKIDKTLGGLSKPSIGVTMDDGKYIEFPPEHD